MNKAGDYSSRMEWMQQSFVQNSLGEKEEVFTSNGYLWCCIDTQTGRRQTDYGAPRSGATATIRIRNYVGVVPLDRLRNAEFGEFWVIDSISYGDDELICDCYRFEDDIS
jgi:head-tail adaptor